MSWKSLNLLADTRERTGRQRIRIETEVDGQNKGTGSVGGDGTRSSEEILAVETVTKEQNKENTGRLGDGKGKVDVTCWTALVFPGKRDVRSWTEVEVGGLGGKMIYYRL